MEPSRRVRIGLALHALSGAFFVVRDQEAFAVMAALLAASSALLAATLVKRVAAIGAGALMGALFITISHRALADFGHVLLLLAMAVPACIDAAGTSFREGRTRWLWLRALLLLLAVATMLGFWPAPQPSTLLPALLLSHVLLRASDPSVARVPLALRPLVAMLVASVALLLLSELFVRGFELGTVAHEIMWVVPRLPFASLALGVAFLAAVLRVAPRAGLDGAIAAAIALAVATDARLHIAWTSDVLLGAAACWVATSMASRHVALRVFAGATVVAGAAIAHAGASDMLTALVAVSVAFTAIAALVVRARAPAVPGTTKRPSAPPVAPEFARMGALLHMAALCLTVFVPSASLAALVPAVVFATRPLARFGTLALVTAAWATGPLVAHEIGLWNEREVAYHAWAPWLMLALLEAIRSRGHPLLVARLGVTVGALLFSLAAIEERASLVVALLPGAVVVQAVLERAAGTLRPLPRVEALAVVVAVPLLAGIAIFEFVMRWLVSKDGFYPYWDLHPITLFLIDGIPALACVWLVAQAGLRRALPFLAPGGAMLAAAGVVVFAQSEGHEHELAAIAVAMFCAGAVTRPPLARLAGAWCALVAVIVVVLRGSLPRPDVIVELGYPLWVIFWFGALVAALVLSDAMRAAPLLPASVAGPVAAPVPPVPSVPPVPAPTPAATAAPPPAIARAGVPEMPRL